MKTLTLKTLAAASSIVAFAGLAVVPAYADTPKNEYLGISSFESTKSLDEVQQEYFQAMKDGSLGNATDSLVDVDTPVLAKTAPSDVQSQDVYAETIEWMRTNTTEIGMGE